MLSFNGRNMPRSGDLFSSNRGPGGPCFGFSSSSWAALCETGTLDNLNSSRCGGGVIKKRKTGYKSHVRGVACTIASSKHSQVATMSMSKLLALLAVTAPTFALPDATRILNARASTCTPKAGGSSSTDDVPAITSAIASCGSGGTIIIPSGTTYYLNSVLDFSGCADCDFQVEGLLKFSSDTDYWEGRTAMINVKGIDGIKIRSVTGSGVIDGNGQNA